MFVPARSRRPTLLVSACLLASGAVALVYEVVWARLLGLVMGHTAYALSAILTSFLGGLALGAWFAGRWTTRHTASLRHYAAVEAGVGVFGGLMPWLIALCEPLFGVAYRALGGHPVAYNLVQFFVCGAVLLVPAVLMGTTLPLVTAVLVRAGDGVGVRGGRLYAANTIGGALGAAACGFFLLPVLGMRTAGLLAAATNLAIAAVAWLLAPRVDPAPDARPSSGPIAQEPPGRSTSRGPRATASRGVAARGVAADWPAPPLALLVVLYGVAGFASLTLEVGWVRLVSLSIGSTTYGFTTTLVTFIAGLALGVYAATRLPFVLARPVASLFWLNVAVALWSLLSLPYLGSLPVRVAELITGAGGSWAAVVRGEVLLVASTILVPALAMGAMFPLAVELVHRAVGSSGASVGLTYAANTWGNIVGSFVAGFVLVPLFGMRGTITVSALLSTGVAASLLAPAWAAARTAVLLRLGGLVAAVALAVALVPAWDRGLITSGAYVNTQWLVQRGQKNVSRAQIEQLLHADHDEVVDYREGATAVVAVKRKGGLLRLTVGGYSEAASVGQVQNLLGHLPLLLHGSARSVLIVGLGGGTTLGSVLRHPVEAVDTVEISTEVRDAMRVHFSRFTGAPLDDPRVHLIIGDGRNHLAHAQKTYDVVISQPSVPWFSGAAGMFTREGFADMRAALRPGGVAAIWYVSWTDQTRDLLSLLRSWTDVFPNAYLFETRAERTFLLVGYVDPEVRLAADRVRDGLARPAVGQEMASFAYENAGDVLGAVIVGREVLQSYAAPAPLNTDDTAYIEFAGPAGMLGRDRMDLLRELKTLWSLRAPATRYVDMSRLPASESEALTAQLDAAYRARALTMQAREVVERGGGQAQWLALMREAAALNPRDPYVMAMSQ
jgi:spermidine synthase